MRPHSPQRPRHIGRILGWACLLLAAWQVAPAELVVPGSTAPTFRRSFPPRIFFQIRPPVADPEALNEEETPGPGLPSAHQLIRVRLFAENTIRSITIRCEKPLSVAGQKVGNTVTFSAAHGRLVVSPARKQLHLKTTVVQGKSGSLLAIRVTGGPLRLTQGRVEVRAAGNRLEIINTLPFDRYAMGVVKPELGSLSLKPAVLMAQLIAARSYALTMRGRHRRAGYDFCDGPHCQVFGGVPVHEPAFEKAAAACRGEYLLYNGKPAAAFFHHSCGGRTAAYDTVWPGAKIPYLRSVRDGSPRAYCDRRGTRSAWIARLDLVAVQKALIAEKLLPKGETLEVVKVASSDESGRAHQIFLFGTRQRWVRGARFMNALNRRFGREVLLSTAFKISRHGNSLWFEGHGWGHGVGLCQEGAIEMAREGKTYRQILAHYYPGTTVAQLSN